jgi:ATP-dependent Clp protease ATP-binding subunit ClpC
MFERYTENARRALFFARYDVTRLGGAVIATEHILLGVLREPGAVVGGVFAARKVSVPQLRDEVERSAKLGDIVTTSTEIPFSVATKRVLNFAKEEADLLGSPDIDCEHLLLGLLRETTESAVKTLTSHGLTLEGVRSHISARIAASRNAR